MCANFQSKWKTLNLEKLPNYVEGVAESWVEAEMSLVEVGGAGWRLKSTGWSWMELVGGGCTV